MWAMASADNGPWFLNQLPQHDRGREPHALVLVRLPPKKANGGSTPPVTLDEHQGRMDRDTSIADDPSHRDDEAINLSDGRPSDPAHQQSAACSR